MSSSRFGRLGGRKNRKVERKSKPEDDDPELDTPELRQFRLDLRARLQAIRASMDWAQVVDQPKGPTDNTYGMTPLGPLNESQAELASPSALSSAVSLATTLPGGYQSASVPSTPNFAASTDTLTPDTGNPLKPKHSFARLKERARQGLPPEVPEDGPFLGNLQIPPVPPLPALNRSRPFRQLEERTASPTLGASQYTHIGENSTANATPTSVHPSSPLYQSTLAADQSSIPDISTLAVEQPSVPEDPTLTVNQPSILKESALASISPQLSNASTVTVNRLPLPDTSTSEVNEENSAKENRSVSPGLRPAPLRISPKKIEGIDLVHVPTSPSTIGSTTRSFHKNGVSAATGTASVGTADANNGAVEKSPESTPTKTKPEDDDVKWWFEVGSPGSPIKTPASADLNESIWSEIDLGEFISKSKKTGHRTQSSPGVRDLHSPSMIPLPVTPSTASLSSPVSSLFSRVSSRNDNRVASTPIHAASSTGIDRHVVEWSGGKIDYFRRGAPLQTPAHAAPNTTTQQPKSTSTLKSQYEANLQGNKEASPLVSPRVKHQGSRLPVPNSAATASRVPQPAARNNTAMSTTRSKPMKCPPSPERRRFIADQLEDYMKNRTTVQARPKDEADPFLEGNKLEIPGNLPARRTPTWEEAQHDLEEYIKTHPEKFLSEDDLLRFKNITKDISALCGPQVANSDSEATSEVTLKATAPRVPDWDIKCLSDEEYDPFFRFDIASLSPEMKAAHDIVRVELHCALDLRLYPTTPLEAANHVIAYYRNLSNHPWDKPGVTTKIKTAAGKEIIPRTKITPGDPLADLPAGGMELVWATRFYERTEDEANAALAKKRDKIIQRSTAMFGNGGGDPQTAGPKIADHKTVDPKIAGTKAASPKTASLKTVSPQTAGSQTTASKTTSPKTAGSKTTSPVTASPKTAGIKTAGPKTAGPKTLRQRAQEKAVEEYREEMNRMWGKRHDVLVREIDRKLDEVDQRIAAGVNWATAMGEVLCLEARDVRHSRVWTDTG